MTDHSAIAQYGLVFITINYSGACLGVLRSTVGARDHVRKAQEILNSYSVPGSGYLLVPVPQYVPADETDPDQGLERAERIACGTITQ
jgi:hypothetical protein